MEIAWNKLSPEEKMERRFAAWLAAEDHQFVSVEAEMAYKARVKRLADTVQLRKTPDRVPVSPSMGSFAARYAGFSERDMMYDPDKVIAAATKCTLDFEPDTKVGVGSSPGRVYDILDYKLYNWPGHGVSAETGIQFVEGEYMKPEEYDALIDDPADFWQRVYLPRILGALQPLSMLLPTDDVVEMPSVSSMASRFGLPEVQAGFQKLFEAGREAIEWQRRIAPGDRKLEEMGFPGFAGGSTRAPFDAIGDTLRGTRGIVLDMFRQPGKLLEALDRITPLMIRMGVSSARIGAPPFIMIPLHKGADGFMSDQQFETFYWPTLRKVILGLINEGLVPRLFAEGSYASRLKIIRNLPRGKTIWYFDYTDMALAKEILGDIACIMGNVPVALIHAGTEEETIAYCRKLIDTAGKGGGFILATGAGIDKKAKVENVRAMIRCAKEYGSY